MSGYLILALPLYVLGQAAIAFDLGMRAWALWGHRVNHALLLALGAVPCLVFWAPWILAAAAPEFAHRARPWVWTQGAAGGVWFAIYLIAPLPGVIKRPASVIRVSIAQQTFSPDATAGGRPVCVEVRRDRLPVGPDRSLLRPVAVGVLSDLHVYRTRDLPFINWCVDRLNALEIDLAVVLGDLTKTESMVGPVADALSRITAPLGSYVVMGNHDLFLGAEHAERALRTRSGHALRPASGEREITPGLTLTAAEWPFGDDARDALPARRDGDTRFRVLLSHSPDNLAPAVNAGFDLVLAAHTHGGFPYVPGLGSLVAPVRGGRAMAEGWFRRGRVHLFITRGVGYVKSSPIPARPQIARIDIEPRNAGDPPS